MYNIINKSFKILISLAITVYLLVNAFTIIIINTPKIQARPLSAIAQDRIAEQAERIWYSNKDPQEMNRYIGYNITDRWTEYHDVLLPPKPSFSYWVDCSSFIATIFHDANISTINNLVNDKNKVPYVGYSHISQPWKTADFVEDLKKSTRKFTVKQNKTSGNIDTSQLITGDVFLYEDRLSGSGSARHMAIFLKKGATWINQDRNILMHAASIDLGIQTLKADAASNNPNWLTAGNRWGRIRVLRKEFN